MKIQRKMKRIFGDCKWLLGLFLFLPMLCYAQASAEKLSQQLSNFQSMQGEFQQALKTGDGKVLQNSSGTMAIVRPGKFRWDIQKPASQLIVTDGKMLWIYDKDLEQVTVQKFVDAPNSPAKLLSGSVDEIMRDFKITEVNRPDGTWYHLVPVDNSSLFQAIELLFSEGHLQQMFMRDHLNQETHLIFSNVKINAKFSPGLFHFTPPKGVDVVGASY